MRLFWKIYAGFWVAIAVVVGGAIAIALMPAMIVSGAAFLLPYMANDSGGQSQSLAHATAALGVITAILALGMFSAIHLALRALFGRLPRRNATPVAMPPAE